MATPASPFRERDAVFHIQTPAHFDAIGSSVRLGIVEFFRSRGPMAVSELAVLIGRPADRLYHHLKKLESAGLLREVGTRQRGRQIERIFDITADELRVAEDAAQLVRIWRLISSHAQRNLAAAIESGIIHFRGEDRNLAMRVETAQLDDEARSKVFEHLDAIRAVFSQARSEPRGTQTSLTFVFTPNPSTSTGSANASGPVVSQKQGKKTPPASKPTGTNSKNTSTTAAQAADSRPRRRASS